MTQTTTFPRAEIERRLRAEVPSVAPAVGDTEVRSIFDRAVSPSLLEAGITCDLIEVYTIAKRVRHREVGGVHYIIFDHALLEAFALLDGLCEEGIPAQPRALAMSRLFAEACRGADRGLLYAFFIVSGLRVSPLLARSKPWLRFPKRRSWQILLLLSHEAAHALPASHPKRKELLQSAAFSASLLITDLLRGLTGQLLAFLDDPDDEFARQAKIDVDVWLSVRDELHVDDDTLFGAFEKVGTDPRFLDEIACDGFAIAALARDIRSDGRAAAPSNTAAASLDALVQAYRAFLHLRLLTYIGEVASNIEKLIETTRVEPFKLILWVEILFRGHLFVRGLIAVGETILANEAMDDLRRNIAQVQNEHTVELFTIANSVVESTLLADDFQRGLPHILQTEGLDGSRIADDLFDIIDDLDEMWIRQIPHIDGHGSPSR